jgi:hypothetical protein
MGRHWQFVSTFWENSIQIHRLSYPIMPGFGGREAIKGETDTSPMDKVTAKDINLSI